VELAQQVAIDFDEPNKIIIKDKLIGLEFLTGMIAMSLKTLYCIICRTDYIRGLFVYTPKTQKTE
jgi:hypothetical protein